MCTCIIKIHGTWLGSHFLTELLSSPICFDFSPFLADARNLANWQTGKIWLQRETVWTRGSFVEPGFDPLCEWFPGRSVQQVETVGLHHMCLCYGAMLWECIVVARNTFFFLFLCLYISRYCNLGEEVVSFWNTSYQMTFFHAQLCPCFSFWKVCGFITLTLSLSHTHRRKQKYSVCHKW